MSLQTSTACSGVGEEKKHLKKNYHEKPENHTNNLAKKTKMTSSNVHN
jgi:hypothetical protein